MALSINIEEVVKQIAGAIKGKAPIVHTHSATDIDSGTLSLDRLAPSSVIRVVFSGTWPSRPTSRTNVYVDWVGGTTQPPGMIAGDTWTRAA